MIETRCSPMFFTNAAASPALAAAMAGAENAPLRASAASRSKMRRLVMGRSILHLMREKNGPASEDGRGAQGGNAAKWLTLLPGGESSRHWAFCTRSRQDPGENVAAFRKPLN